MNCRFVICIPVYNNPGTINDVINSCLTQTSLPILVIDDGSDQIVENIYKQNHPSVHSRVTFLKHEKNQGKGVALQTGFKFALQQSFTHLIAIDADGQHLPSEINQLVQESLNHPWALIVGDRNMQVANVPESSAFGKKFSNFWVRYQTDVGVADSQSGFRIYPLFYLQNMRFFCKKYDFEIEVLIRLIWKGVPVKNTKISVVYFPKDVRVSHFHKWKDNYRISVLNTFLTIASLLREQVTPFKSSLALGLGVFIGTLPLYGLHTGIVAAMAFALRLNFIYLWVGTNISIPPLIPFLLLASQYIGEKILLPTTHTMADAGLAVILGSPILGLLLGVIFFVVIYNVKLLLLRKKSKRTWTGENKNKLGISIVRFILKTLGLNMAYFCLYFIVFYYFLFSLRTRKSFNEYWRVIRPQMPWFQRQWKIYIQILTFAKTLVDRGRQKESSKMYYSFEYDPSSHEFLSHFKKGAEGAVAVASHVGGWELATTFFSQVPTNKKILAVMHGILGQYDHSSSESAEHKAEVVFSNLDQSSLLKIKNYLSSGQIVGMMGDRPVTNSFELIPFFGKLAAFDTTPIRTALACQVNIYFVLSVKVSKLEYKIFAFKGRPTIGKNKHEQTHEILNQYVRGLQTIINKYPEQWFNFFPFWSEAPQIN